MFRVVQDAGMDPRALLTLRQMMVMASGATSTRLLRAERLGVSLGEETLTEMLVLELLERLRGSSVDFRLHTFNHHQEALNGADLQVWVNLDDALIGYSIQCKKVIRDSQGRSVAKSLDHRVGKKRKRQIDILRASAVRDQTNPVHVLYQSPSVGRSNGLAGGCSAMPTVAMDRRMSTTTGGIAATNVGTYTGLLFPWEMMVDPPSPGRITVPWTVVPRSPRTHADMIDMFGSFGVDLGSAIYGRGQGAYEYGLVLPSPAVSGGGEDGPDGPDSGAGGTGPSGGVGGTGIGQNPSGGFVRVKGPGLEASSARETVKNHSEGADHARRGPDGQEPTSVTEPAEPSASLLNQTVPRRVLHIGNPVEIGEHAVPRIVQQQGSRAAINLRDGRSNDR